MKRCFALLSFLFLSSWSYSQTGALENFNDNVLDPAWTSTAGKFTLTETNSELKIVTSSVGPSYENLKYTFTSVDLTNNPVVSVKVKNATAFNLRIDLIDVSGKSTNQSPISKAIAASAGYITYTFDFTGRFNQSSPTSSTVDKTKITTAVFFFNAGGTSYSGTVYFDDVTIGDAIPVVPTVPGNIRINQIGYELNGPKVAVFESTQSTISATTFDVVNASDVSVFTGNLVSKGAVAGWTGRYFWEMDFSSFKQAGTYKVKIGSKASYQFEIGSNLLFNKTASSIVDFFKGMRYTGTSDNSLSFNGPRNDFVNVYGGWRDAAGDQGKHMSHLSYANYFNPQQIPFVAWSLLKSYEMSQASFATKSADLLSEARWGADYLLRNIDKQQNYLYLSVFDDWGNNPSTREICEWSGSDGVRSANYQAAMREGAGTAIAALARAYKMNLNGDSTANQYLQGAIRLYNNLKAPGSGYATKNLEYCNDHQENIIDNYCGLLASVELYKATGQSVYKTDAMAYVDKLVNRMDSQGWFKSDDAGARPFYHAADEGSVLVALMEFMDIDNSKNAAILNVINKNIQWYFAISKEVTNPFSYLREYYKPYSSSTLGSAKKAFFLPHSNETGYWWQGENARLASMTTALLMAARKLDSQYMIGTDSISRYGMAQLDWILGKNPFDVCMMYGFGSKSYPNYPASAAIPNIKGGICNGITSKDSDENDIDWMPYASSDWQNWRWIEQWLPHDAWFLLAVSSIDQVLNNPAPTANFSVSSATPCTTTNVTFTNTSIGGITSYSWNFGTGATPATATTVGPHTVSWSGAGDKTVTLTVTGSGGSNVKTMTISVGGVPASAGTISGPQTVCANQTGVVYSVASINGASTYNWSVPSGYSIYSGETTASITVNIGTETGNITVAADNACGTGQMQSLPITVNPVVAPGTVSPATQQICTGTAPSITQTAATGGTSTYNYVWQQASSATGPWSDLTSQTAASLGTINLIAPIYYRRKVSSGTCADVYTTPVFVDVSSGLNPGTVSGDQTICNNSVPTSFISTALASNGVGQASTYNYLWQASTNSGATWIDLSNATSASYTETSPLTSTTQYRRRVRYGTTTCNTAYSNVITITVNPIVADVPAPAITQNCGNTIVALSATPSGIEYYWQTSSNGTDNATPNRVVGSKTLTSATTLYVRAYNPTTSCWSSTARTINVTVKQVPADPTSISGASPACPFSVLSIAAAPVGATYYWQATASGTSQTNDASTSLTVSSSGTYYVRAISTDGCWSVNSSSISIAITSGVSPGTIAGSQTICSNALPTAFTNETEASNGVGPASTYVYQWQKSTNSGITWTDISSSNSTGFAEITALSTTTQYRRKVTYGTTTCNTSYSNVITITVNPAVANVPAPTLTQNCGNTLVSLSAAPSGIDYYWQTSSTGTDNSAASKVTGSKTLTTAATLYVRAYNSTTGCWSANTRVINATVNQIPATPTSISGASPACPNSILTVAAAPAGVTYYWQSTAPAGTSLDLSASSPYTVTTSGTYYVRAYNNTTNCWSANSASLAVVINSLDAGTISSDETVCEGLKPATITGTVASGGNGTYTYAWELSTTSATTGFTSTGSASKDLGFASAVTQTTYYRRKVTSGTCENYSNTVTKTLKTKPLAAGTIEGAASVCANKTDVIYSIPTVTGAISYAWTVPSDASITSAMNTNTINISFGALSGSITVAPVNGCGNGVSSSKAITVMPIGTSPCSAPVTSSIVGPVSVTSNQPGVVFSVTDHEGSEYNWTIPAGATIVSGQGTHSIVVNFGESSGEISVTESNEYGTGAAVTQQITVSGLTSVYSVSSTMVNVAPNPFTGTTVLKTTGAMLDNVSIVITDIKGREVRRIEEIAPGTEFTIGEDLDRGIYTLTLISKNQAQVLKLVKVD